MLTPDYLQHCVDDIIKLYQALEDSIIQDMARRIVTMGVTESSAYQYERAQVVGAVRDDVLTQLAGLTSKSREELSEAFTAAGAKSLGYDAEVYKAVGLLPIPLNQSPGMLQTLLAGLQKTQGQIQNMTMTTALTAPSQFASALDLAYMQMSSGAMSYTQAISNAVKSLGADGITIIEYQSNGKVRYDKVDVAVRRATLTGINQTTAKLQLMNAGMMGSEFVETTAHYDSREDHVHWQGQVFHLYGGRDGYPDFYSVTEYGSVQGLCGINCRHSFFPFFPGYSSRTYSDRTLKEYAGAKVEYNGKEMSVYQATQMQRKMERGIRETKRELSALNSGMQASSGDLQQALRSEFATQSVVLKQQEAALKGFLAQTNLRMQSDRVQVLEFGQSAAQKAIAANRKLTDYASVVGLKTSNGIVISGFAEHATDRIIERKVYANEIAQALQTPLKVGIIRVDAAGRSSQQFVGPYATASVNPDTGVLVTAWKTHTKTRLKLQRK